MSRVEGQRTGVAFPPLNECQRQAPPSGLLVPGLLLLVLLLLGRGRSRGRLYTRRLQHYSVRSVVRAVRDTFCDLRSANTPAVLQGRGFWVREKGRGKESRLGLLRTSVTGGRHVGNTRSRSEDWGTEARAGRPWAWKRGGWGARSCGASTCGERGGARSVASTGVSSRGLNATCLTSSPSV